jgi:hypothetical protein
VAARGLWLNVAVKALLVGLLLFSVFSGLERFNGKAMLVRALTYPIAALVVPVAWRLRGARRPYPHLVDALIVLPFVIDTGGNVLDLYSVSWFDDLAHFPELVDSRLGSNARPAQDSSRLAALMGPRRWLRCRD